MKKVILILYFAIAMVSIVACYQNELSIDNSPTEDKVIETPAIEKGYVYLHRSTIIDGNDREEYIWEVLRLSLEATVEDYGPYEIRNVEDINQAREDVELINESGVISIISDSLNETNINNLNRIPFPLLRNLLGYRVFFIDSSRQEEFERIVDADSLKPYVFGIGKGWNDKIILEHSNYKVYEASTYNSLYRSLMSGDFDIFSRGVNEVLGEYETYKETYPKLYIDENVLLYYPLPRYFWFSKTEYGNMLEERVEIGLNRIVDDGRFYELFDHYFADMLEELNLESRTFIELENPIYDESFDSGDAPYRYNPFD